ncbi:hypothetical protein GSI_01004 [Ganoderma sinense ZZ0214-1]|uniref:Uncharacterized protein n=1 Tax=Ganoderma sinense ZZ0214-1 TaxID=1077348 RepID=A0A2G8SU56_9APHY|nr:hypothetical protein GSI_01004 [Ganoderma sinense ZZ0214-1]
MMPRSFSSYGSPPPSYSTIAPSKGYGTVGSSLQPSSQYTRSSRRNGDLNGPTGTETSPLWSGTTVSRRLTHRISMILCGIVAVLLVIVFAQNTGLWPTLADDIPASEKAARRQSWHLEKQMWVMERGQWALEQSKHEEMWGRERKARQEERDAFKQEKAEWELERQARQKERDAFEREKAEWARQRREEENHRKEVEWQRRGAYWSEPWPGSSQCHGYGTRPYSANLLNLPEGVDYREACKDMPIKINGRWMDSPNKCEQDKHNTWGTWYVNFGESQCVTYWDPFLDKGCSPDQTGMRKYEAPLRNLRRGDDWDLMCSTTPATIRGVHFDSPKTCEIDGHGGRTVGNAYYELSRFLPRGTHMIWGINLGANNVTNAVNMAKAIASCVVLDLLEVGNEADLYRKNGLRPSNWTVQDYVPNWISVADPAVAAAGISGPDGPVSVQGAAFGQGFTPTEIFNLGILDSAPGKARDNPPAGLHALTLWTIDYTLQAATLGIKELFFHEGIGYKYDFASIFQPVTLNRSTTDGSPLDPPSAPHIQPSFYGAIVINSFVGKTGASKIVELDVGDSNVSGCAVFEGNAVKRAVFINLHAWLTSSTGTRPSVHIDLDFASGPSASQSQVDAFWSRRHGGADLGGAEL